jgi:hypothetical protein
LPSWLRTPPIPRLEALQSTSNNLEKFGSIRVGASVIFCLRSSKLFWASFVYLNIPPLRHFVMGAIMVLQVIKNLEILSRSLLETTAFKAHLP